jgi:hypothetical protein
LWFIDENDSEANWNNAFKVNKKTVDFVEVYGSSGPG